MSENEQSIEWYLARDGKQYGPLTDLEINKLHELGHLRQTDLVWRLGMADWAAATSVFPPSQPAPPPVQPVPQRVAAPEPSLQRRLAAQPTEQRPVEPEPQSHPAAETRAHRPAAAPAPAPVQTTGPATERQPAWAIQPRSANEAVAPHGQPAPGSAATPAPAAVHRQPAPARPYHPAPAPAEDKYRHPSGAHPAQAAPQAATANRAPATPVSLDTGPDAFDLPKRRFPVKVALAIVVLSVIGGAAAVLHRSGKLAFIASPFVGGTETGSPPVVRAPATAMKEPALIIAGDTSEAIDGALQRAPLWKLIKREFPVWYTERVADAVKMRGEKTDDREIAVFLTKSLVDLRRRNADAAMAASPERLRFVAASFVENLASLAKHSVDACYGFISQGESSPLVVDIMRSPSGGAAMQAQFTAIFEAIAEGRKIPKKHAAPQREDYDVLAQQLAQKGWSPSDLQTFSDARALARAEPERVCKMVQDWFAAQLAVKDEATQLRLLVEALKPVFAG